MPPFTRFSMDVPRRPALKDSARNYSNIDRRKFLSATGGGLLAAAALPGIASAEARDAGASTIPGFGGAPVSAESSNPARGQGSGAKKRIPIGVFDPVYDNMSLDQMLDTMNALGMEAVEVGTGGYPNNPHCPLDELIADKPKAKAWQIGRAHV